MLKQHDIISRQQEEQRFSFRLFDKTKITGDFWPLILLHFIFLIQLSFCQ